MAERIDGVFVELKADVDASGVIKSEQAITTSAKKIQNEFKKTDAALSGTGKALARQSKQSQKSAGSMAGMGRSAGQASIQLQQFTGQVSGGVNPLIAFSQQAADLGIVMGAPLLGSIVGIGAAIGVVLLPELFKSTSAIEDLEKAIESLEAVAKKGDEGILEFSESIKELGKISNSLVLAQLEVAVDDARKAVTVGLNEIRDQFSKEIGAGVFGGIGVSLDRLSQATKDGEQDLLAFSSAFTKIGEKFGSTGKKANELGKEILNIFIEAEKAKTPESINALQIRLNELTKTAKDAPKELKALVVGLNGIFERARKAAIGAQELEARIKDAGNAAVDVGFDNEAIFKTQAIVATLTQQLALTKVETEQGANAARRMALAFELSDGASAKLPANITALISELERAEAQQKAMAKAEMDDASAFSKFKTDLAAEEAKQKGERGSNLERVRNEFKLEGELLAEKYANELVLLEQSLINGELKRDEFDTLRKQKAEKLANDIGEINKKETDRKKKEEENKKQTTLGYASSTFGALSTLMNTESRKLFEIGKAAAIGQAIVDGYAAVSKTMASVPYPFNIPLAVAQGAASAVQIQGIAKQKFGGAGGGSNTFSGGLPATRTTGGGAGGGGQDRNISIAGIDANSLISGGQLVDTLNQALGDGYTVNFAGG